MFGVWLGQAVCLPGIRASCLKDPGYKRRAQVHDKTVKGGQQVSAGCRPSKGFNV